MKDVYLGAYAAEPPCGTDDHDEQYYRAIRELLESQLATGLEIPYHAHPVEGVHARGLEWLMSFIPHGASLIITCLPAQMQSMSLDPCFGLASCDQRGRMQAIEIVQRAISEIVNLKRVRPDLRVVAVEVHSGPRPVGAQVSSEMFHLSLREVLQSPNWPEGLELWVEHCDAYQSGQPPEKGFLGLSDEIAVIKALSHEHGIRDRKLGILLNWGRSAIEARSENRPIEHLRLLQGVGLLKGMIFSGATASHALYGEWNDRHGPIREAVGDESQLLTRAHVQAIVAAIGSQAARSEIVARSVYGAKSAILGLKVQPLPKHLTVAERSQILRRHLELLREVQVAQS
jgi:hypothetical protein